MVGLTNNCVDFYKFNEKCQFMINSKINCFIIVRLKLRHTFDHFRRHISSSRFDTMAYEILEPTGVKKS